MEFVDGPNDYIIATNNPLLWIDPWGESKRFVDTLNLGIDIYNLTNKAIHWKGGVNNALDFAANAYSAFNSLELRCSSRYVDKKETKYKNYYGENFDPFTNEKYLAYKNIFQTPGYETFSGEEWISNSIESDDLLKDYSVKEGILWAWNQQRTTGNEHGFWIIKRNSFEKWISGDDSNYKILKWKPGTDSNVNIAYPIPFLHIAPFGTVGDVHTHPIEFENGGMAVPSIGDTKSMPWFSPNHNAYVVSAYNIVKYNAKGELKIQAITEQYIK